MYKMCVSAYILCKYICVGTLVQLVEIGQMKCIVKDVTMDTIWPFFNQE